MSHLEHPAATTRHTGNHSGDVHGNTLSREAARALRHPDVNAPELATRLKEALKGEVRFDAGSRAVYAADASNYRQVPIGVVVPNCIEDVIETVKACHAAGAPLLGRGGGTSQNGQCVNVAVVIDTSKYLNRILRIDPHAALAWVEPGVVCDQLRDAAELHGLTFGPDPATHSRCTLGGMIGNNSCGAHSVMAGKTIENLEALEVLTYDGARFWTGPTSPGELDAIIQEGGRRGEIYHQLKELRDRYAEVIRSQFPRIKRRVSGFNLEQLLPENGFNVARALVGTEGTCALTLQATVRLVRSPAHRALLVLGYPDVFSAADATMTVMALQPIALEGLDEPIVGGLRERGLKLDDIKLLPDGKGWMIVEFGADTVEEVAAKANDAMLALEQCAHRPASMKLFLDPALQSRIWSIRELGASATSMSDDPSQPDPVVGWEDAAVDPARLGDYLRAFQKLIDDYRYQTCLYGHFGDGCVHARINFDLRSEAGLLKMRAFLKQAAELVVTFGGSLSGEHGDGQAKAEFLPIMFSPELMQAFREFKAIWDPYNRMNPGKVIDAYRFDENLRLGPAYQPRPVKTHFSFAENRNSFSRATEHCIGMGRCRAHQGGTMCPSYRATLEETYSPRGRSRLFFEMLQGQVIKDGWHSTEVKQALDNCLSCKGCRKDCPTHVDIATYKAEFLSHYYEVQPRPVRMQLMSTMHKWARWGVRFSTLLNVLMRSTFTGGIVRKILDFAPQRALPEFASQSFTSWFKRHPQPAPATQGKVILWPDTFNNHYHPEILQAATKVLTRLGYDVALPARRVCCGRPLYEAGKLDQAKAMLLDVLDCLKADIAAGVPVVFLEPACASVFRDEMQNLLPDNADAKKLGRQTRLFGEFLVNTPALQPATLRRKAILHQHCHQKSLFNTQADLEVLRKLGIEVQQPESGCCGMAGSFGFERDKYELSMKIGERALLPAVRAADPETLVIHTGYSCGEQISHGAGIRPMHLAQVVLMALDANRATLQN